MSLIYHRLHIKSTILLIIFSLLIPTIPVQRAGAEEVPNTSRECVDVVLVFTRGSGQNSNHELIDDPLNARFFPNEKESYTFFRNHADHFDNDFPHISYKAVSVHDFPGKYDPVGYQAMPVGWDTPEKLANSVNSDASWVPGAYQSSVEHGTAETVGYLKDQIASCPDQYFIVGGYSQGAQVMGEALFRLSEQEQGKILGVGFFGDPKYIGSSDGLPLKPDATISFPWRRGEATNKDTGMLDPRIPYTPQNMENRTLSWCNRNDIVCAGWSALRKNSSHSSYSESAIGYAVNELVGIATPQLLALERNHGGINGDIPTTQMTKADRDRERDIMFLFNDNSNVDVIRTLKQVDPMLPNFARDFTGTRFAAKSFGEHDYGSFQAPRVDNIQSFLPLFGYDPSRPSFTSSNLSAAMYSKYGMLQFIIGGGDIDDPHQLALERAITSTSWSENPNVERNIILITDRPPKDPYEYNICNSTVRQWMHFPVIDGYKNCYTNYHREIWQKVLVPETCEKIDMVIFDDTCTNPLMSPHYIQTNKRTLEDEIKLAQAYNTKISVVIPHKFDPQIHSGNKLSDPAVRDKLRHLAHATGGSFIYYDQRTEYNSTLLHDTLWQVFTKQPRSLKATANGGDGKVLGLKTNTPTIIDVSRSGVVASSYKWDFDDNGTWDQTTPGPVTEYEFPAPTQGLFRVQALGSTGAVLADTRQIYTVTPGEEPAIVKPTVPEGIVAAQQADGSVLVTWVPEASNDLIIFDPVTNLPIGSAPLQTGIFTLPISIENIQVRVISDSAASDPVTIPVTTYVPPEPPPTIVELPVIQLPNVPPVPVASTDGDFAPNPQPTRSIPQPVVEDTPTPTRTTTQTNTPITRTDVVLTSPATNSSHKTTDTPRVEGISVDNSIPVGPESIGIASKTPPTKQNLHWLLMVVTSLAAAGIYLVVRVIAKPKE